MSTIDCQTSIDICRNLTEGDPPLTETAGEQEKNLSWSLQPGLHLSISSYQFEQSHRIRYQIPEDDLLVSHFYVQGQCHIINPQLNEETDRVESCGQNCICYLSGLNSIDFFPAQQRLQILGILMESIFLEKLLADIDRSPSPLQRFLQSTSPERFHQSLRETTPLMQQTLHQLLECPYQGVLQQIYLEGKTLELLVLQMACWSEQLEMQVGTRLQPKDIELIHQAGAFLKENWTDPPSLFKLARQVGLNDFKLKQGFRQVFGTTVFGYLQAYRMEQARQLLWDRHVSVAGVARAIGYVSPSAFSAAFRRHFGSSPKTFRQPE